MKILKKILNYILSQFTKVQLSIVIVLIITCFLISDSNIFTRIGYDLEISNIKNQIEYYKTKSIDDKRKLKELQSDKDDLEKFARENYLMKEENEEVFIVE